jgi:DNA-binding NarL/FixJ family response regulator
MLTLPEQKRAKKPQHGEVSPRNVSGKKFGLTAREVEIVNAIVDGQSNRDIAQTYGITECTVKHHLTRIFDKMGVYSRLELAVFALHHDMSSPLEQPESGRMDTSENTPLPGSRPKSPKDSPHDR